MNETQFKVGDKVKIVDASRIIGGGWSNGDIVEVVALDGDGWPHLHAPRSKTNSTKYFHGKPAVILCPSEYGFVKKVEEANHAHVFKERLAQLKKELAATNDALEVDILLARIDELGRIQKLLEEE